VEKIFGKRQWASRAEEIINENESVIDTDDAKNSGDNLNESQDE
jgi:hypothetical protein